MAKTIYSSSFSSDILEPTITRILEENGLEANTGSYDDYRDAMDTLFNIYPLARQDKENYSAIVKNYFNVL